MMRCQQAEFGNGLHAGVSARSPLCFRGWDLDTASSVWCSAIPPPRFFIKETQIEKIISPARPGIKICFQKFKRAKFLLWWVLQSFSTTMITKSAFYYVCPKVFPCRALAPAGKIWLESSKSWFSSRNEYLHWAHAVFTVAKEIDTRFRICNNLDLIEHSAFVTTPAMTQAGPGDPG